MCHTNVLWKSYIRITAFFHFKQSISNEPFKNRHIPSKKNCNPEIRKVGQYTEKFIIPCKNTAYNL